MVIAVAGNKSDQTENKINTEPVLDYCNSRNYDHVEVSAKTGDNVEELFKRLS